MSDMVDNSNKSNIMERVLDAFRISMPATYKAMTDYVSAGNEFTADAPRYDGESSITEAIFWDRLSQIIDITAKDVAKVELVQQNFRDLARHSKAKDLSESDWISLLQANAFEYVEMLKANDVYEYADRVDEAVLNALYVQAVSAYTLSILGSDTICQTIMDAIHKVTAHAGVDMHSLDLTELASVKRYLEHQLEAVNNQEQRAIKFIRSAEETEHQRSVMGNVTKLFETLKEKRVFELGKYSQAEWGKLFDAIVEAGAKHYGIRGRQAKAVALTNRFAHLMNPLYTMEDFKTKDLRWFESLFMLAVSQAVSPDDRIWCNDIIEDALAKAKAIG